MGNYSTKATPVQTWTSQEVYDAVADMGPAYEQFAADLKNHGVDGELLLKMTESDVKDLGIVVSDFHLTKLRKDLENIKTGEGTKVQSSDRTGSGHKVVDIKQAALSMKDVVRSPRDIMQNMFKVQGIPCDPLGLKSCVDTIVKAVKSSLKGQLELEEGKYHAFISYRVATESDTAEKLYYMLKLEGLVPFLDKFCLIDGEDWKVGFLRGLSNSATIIPLISRDGLAMCRDWEKSHVHDNVLLEYQMALTICEQIPDFMVPVLVGKYPEPGVLQKFTDFNPALYSDNVESVMSPEKVEAEERAAQDKIRLARLAAFHAGSGERKDEFEDHNYARIWCPIAGHAGPYHHWIGGLCYVKSTKSPTHAKNNSCGAAHPIVEGVCHVFVALLWTVTLCWQPCGMCGDKVCFCPWLGDCPCSQHRVTHDFVVKWPEKIIRGPAKDRFQSGKPHEYHEQWFKPSTGKTKAKQNGD